MRFTPRQIVVRAQETAYQLLAALDREALVARFLQSYAKDQNRAGVITQPALYRDLMASVRPPRQRRKGRAKRRASGAHAAHGKRVRPRGRRR